MQKLTQLKDNLLELSFLALLIKIILLGTGIGDALAVISLVLSISYNRWLSKNKVDQYEALVAKMDADRELFLKEIEMLNGKVTGLSLDKSIKRTAINEQEVKFGQARRLF